MLKSVEIMSMINIRHMKMVNRDINLKVFFYLLASLVITMIVLFTVLNMAFSLYYYFKIGYFDFNFNKLGECIVLGLLTGPIAASGVWLMLRYRM